MQQLQNPGFETDEAWQFGGYLADYSDFRARTGLRSCILKTSPSGQSSYAFQMFGDVHEGAEVPISGHLYFASGQGGFLPVFKVQYWNAETGLVSVFSKGLFVNPDEWDAWETSFVAPVGGEYGVNLLWDTSSGAVTIFLDDLVVDVPQYWELVMRTNMPAWLDNLKAGIEALDPNLGKVFLAERRWSSADDLQDDGAIVQVNVAGLIDDDEDDFGPATRFWILEPWITLAPGTNQTDDYRGDARIIGFFGYRENESQAIALRDAALEIVDYLALKQTELTDLAAGMGEGYLGYLRERPSMAGPVKAARLQTGHQGHVVIINASYFEEVSRV